MANQELTFKISASDAGFKSAMASARAELTQTAQAQKAVGQGELSMRQQLAAAASLQRQRSAALIADWRQMGASVGVLSGPLNGISGRISSLGTLARTTSGDLESVGAGAESASAGLAGMAGPVGLAIVGIAATAAGVGILAKELFDLAQSAAEWKGALFDTSQQLGISTETLSAFEILAKTTGSDLGSLTASLGIFQKNLESAQDPTSKEGKLLKELGIESTNTEDALRQTLTRLAAMPEGFHQTATALELFGRGGKSMLAILKEMGGDLDGTIKRFREMGLVVSGEDARAADAFNDQIALLGFQMRALGSIIGQQVMPVILKSVKDFSKALNENKDALHALGIAASMVAQLFTIPLKGAIGAVTSAWQSARPTLTLIAELYERIAAATQLISGKGLTVDPNAIAALRNTGVGPVPEVGGEAQFKLPGPKGGFKAATAAADDAAQREFEIQRNLRETLALEFEKRNSDLDTHYKQLQQLTDNHLATVKTQIQAERDALRLGYEQGAIDLVEFNKRKADLDLKATQEQNKRDEETRRLAFEKQKALDQQELDFRQRSSALSEAQREGELARLNAALDRQQIAESQLLLKQLDYLKAAHAERLGLIDTELKALSTSTERKKELDNEKLIEEQKFTDEFKRLTRERIDVMEEESFARREQSLGPTGAPLGDDEIARRAGAAANADPEIERLRARADAAAASARIQADALKELKAIGMDTFDSLAQGVGNLIQRWVLYGNVGPNAVRKMIAAVLAQAAATAAVEAIMELAYAFKEFALAAADAAVFNVAGAALHTASAHAHLTSAAVFGTVAGVAAVSGRVIAGGAFNQSTGGGGNRSSGSSNSGGSSTPATIEVDRNRNQSPITIHIHGEAAAAFNYKVVDAVIDDHRSNGRIRTMIVHDET